MKPSLTYKESGVNIDTGNEFVQRIKPLIAKTQRTEVLSTLGGYAGLFSLNPLKYKDPVLVSTTDGVGTKLKLALELKSYKGLGQDLAAMCVNDLLCVGAEPLFFLDYYATGKLELEAATQVIEGLTQSLKEIHCTLLGGETAEMPGVYAAGDFDLAGFAVGVVSREEIIEGSNISIGNKIVGLASSGLHSNGFSLVRKIIETKKLDLKKVYEPLSKPLGEVLLTPTKIYVNSILKLRKDFELLGIAHITGGGLLENPPRVFPKQCKAIFDKTAFPKLPIFDLLQEWGNIAETEMLRVFNCGIGLILVVAENQANEVVARLNGMGEKASIIGEISERTSSQPSVVFA